MEIDTNTNGVTEYMERLVADRVGGVITPDMEGLMALVRVSQEAGKTLDAIITGARVLLRGAQGSATGSEINEAIEMVADAIAEIDMVPGDGDTKAAIKRIQEIVNRL